MVYSPCIMCVQYIGRRSVHRGVFSTSGGVQYIGGYHESIRGISWVHQGDIMSPSGGVEYIRGISWCMWGISWVHLGCSVHRGISWCIWGIPWIHWGMFSTSGGYHEYIGVFNRNWKVITNLLPHMHHDIPPMYWTSPMYSWYPPRCTHGIPRCTEHPPMYSWYPPTWSWYPPDVLNTPSVLTISPPMYSWYPPMYWTHIIQGDTQERDKIFMEIVLFSQCHRRIKPAHLSILAFVYLWIHMFRTAGGRIVWFDEKEWIFVYHNRVANSCFSFKCFFFQICRYTVVCRNFSW